jgi:hypothetical protein
MIKKKLRILTSWQQFMKYLVLILSTLTWQISFCQEPKTIYRNHTDSSQNFYIVTLPKEKIKGLLVLNYKILSDSAKKQAFDLGICTLTIIPTKNPLDNLLSKDILSIIDDMIGEVIHTYNVSSRNIIIGGMSAAGTGSIRYAEYCYSNKSKNKIKPSGVFGVDPPLDYERLYNESIKAVKRNFNQDAIDESKMLINLLTENLKGTPKTNIKNYQNISPFCYSAENGGKAFLLNQLAVRLYTDPDVNWWIDNRRKDYYDLNSIDNAALINQLKINGNSNAELIITYKKGVKTDNHPHSWNIVDQQELLLWCNKVFNELN